MNNSAVSPGDTQLVSVTPRRLDEPQFEKPIGNHTFHIGREAMLGCSVVNLGRHKVGWLRAEDQTVLSLHDRVVLAGRYSITMDPPRTWQLRIRPLRAEDRGCYMCQINTQPSMKWQIGCIDVYVPPDIINEETSADVAAHEMDNVTLVCKASGHPAPKITWRREDHEPMLLKKVGGRDFYKVDSYVGSSLPLWRVDRRQMGAFLCIASNDVPPAVSKRITLLVNSRSSKTRDDEVVQKYEELVRDEVATWDVDAPIEEEWGKVKKLLTEVAGTAFGHQKAKTRTGSLKISNTLHLCSSPNDKLR
ncbi:immunoglobulin domain-containing protein [Phthorimaea operculella]|nr:immunoglobulin domain-containing protein [Phthorimaea operculella]